MHQGRVTMHASARMPCALQFFFADHENEEAYTGLIASEERLGRRLAE
jgi:hypothetical protein